MSFLASWRGEPNSFSRIFIASGELLAFVRVSTLTISKDVTGIEDGLDICETLIFKDLFELQHTHFFISPYIYSSEKSNTQHGFIVTKEDQLNVSQEAKLPES